jgi:hypothetical protein
VRADSRDSQIANYRPEGLVRSVVAFLDHKFYVIFKIELNRQIKWVIVGHVHSRAVFSAILASLKLRLFEIKEKLGLLNY